VLFDNGNPYSNGLPDTLHLDWADFSCGFSAVNEQALGRMAEWTVVAYLAADCDLASPIFDDLLELKAAGSSRNIHVLVLFDGPLLTDSFFARLNPGTPLGEDIILRFNELKSNDPATITLALRLASAFPARHRLLVFGGHGSGWRGLLLDENDGMRRYAAKGRLVLPGPGAECDARLHADLAKAQDRLNAAIVQAKPADRADIIALDACFMGNIEAVGFFHKYGKTLLVSEDTMPGQGLAYGAMMNALHEGASQTGRELACEVLTATGKFYKDRPEDGPVTLAVLDADKLEPFCEAFVRLVQTLDARDDACFAAMRDALQNAWSFDLTGMIDLKGFVLQVLAGKPPAAVAAACHEVLHAWNDVLIATSALGGPDAPNGLSIYAPPPRAFEAAYIEAANTLPLNLGIWAWCLGAIYLRQLGTEEPGHPLLDSLRATMTQLMKQGIYKP